MTRNQWCLNVAKEITIAKMQNWTASATSDSGKFAAQFLEEVYNKVVELDKKEID